MGSWRSGSRRRAIEYFMTDEQIIDAFHSMWDMFPEPVLLIKKNRDVIAINRKCAELGFLQPGMKCSSVGRPLNTKVVDATKPSIQRVRSP